MKNLKEKLRKNGGFTLVEMLIVVAIIAILIAVSIPLVGNALDRARHATDQANERAAKAEIILQYLAGDQAQVYATEAATDPTVGAIVAGQAYYYDATNGRLTAAAGDITTYGQCTRGTHNTNNILAVSIDEDGVVSMEWTTTTGIGTDEPDDGNLCTGIDVNDHT